MVEAYHTPALLEPCMQGLDINPAGVYVDVTFGGGGHSRAILQRLGPGGRLVAFDQDQDAKANIPPGEDRLTFVAGNFRHLATWLDYLGLGTVDGVMADLGVSFHHFDDQERGFSFRADAPLDMRMNAKGGPTAADILLSYPEERIADVLYVYGELKNSRRLASAIVARRASQPVCTTQGLMDTVAPLLPPQRLKKDMAKVFQALRIEVNDEMGALRLLLEQSAEVIRPGGRLVVLTYHSLEDRMVKNFIRTGNTDGKCQQDLFGNSNAPFRALNSRVITAADEEVALNPRSRSAKLRSAVRLNIPYNG